MIQEAATYAWNFVAHLSLSVLLSTFKVNTCQTSALSFEVENFQKYDAADEDAASKTS